MLATLEKYFGYTTFRPLQQEIIEAVLAARDVLVVMPTGGGKSLCFQLPALLQPGLTVVVSPLISLMKDQVDSLRTNGIAAACWNSALTSGEVQTVRQQMENRQLKLLYLAPERLMLPNFLNYLKTFPLSLFAIDEAHCISEWGHDFRPEYRELQAIRAYFPTTPMIALTATATTRVQEDIQIQLHLQEPRIFKASFNRENLYYEVRPKQKTYQQIVAYLKAHPGQSGIIYCLSRREVEALAEKLQNDGFEALPYHAGLDSPTRTTNQEKFIRDDVQIIVATIAFGMGIDKPNVRFVLHYDLPKNIEGYYQETGRAGRDGLKSDCILFYSYHDRVKIEYFIAEIQKQAERRIALEKLEQMLKYADDTDCRRRYILNYFGETYPTQNCATCDNCLNQSHLVDMTIPAQKIFSCIARVKESFGMTYVIDILKGSKSERLIHNNHQHLSTFGIGSEFTKNDWRAFVRTLVQKKYLEFEGHEYPILKLTPLSHEVLFKGARVMLPKSYVVPEPVAATTTDGEQTKELFAQLRRLRKEIADAEGLPPYMIFPDTTLQALAKQMPQTWEGLKRIPGMGEVKLKRFGPRFLKEVIGFCQQH